MGKQCHPGIFLTGEGIPFRKHECPPNSLRIASWSHRCQLAVVRTSCQNLLEASPMHRMSWKLGLRFSKVILSRRIGTNHADEQTRGCPVCAQFPEPLPAIR